MISSINAGKNFDKIHQSMIKTLQKVGHRGNKPQHNIGHMRQTHADVGDMSSIPGSGRFPGAGNGTPLQSSCLGKFMD